MKDRVEILAPAGSMECLKAAIAAGADAVYTGGALFGARAYAHNLTEEELLEAIDYVHLHGRRLYLTVNTLIKDREMEKQMYDYLLPYYRQGLDAVIVQDMGAFQFIREYFPKMDIHTSTQMTICNRYGAEMMKELGATRVVTAREMSFAEIKDIADHVDIEIESFVHGALCYCYSGQCLLSSMLGGRSGNRGRCAQPCRLPYEVYDAKRKKIACEPFVLSPKDLCTIEDIPKLAESGIFSFKIEGRMKTALYVATVARTYRKAIDDYKKDPKLYEQNMPWYKEQISNCTYRQFTIGFFFGKPDETTQIYDSNTYNKEYTYLGIVGEIKDGLCRIEQRNKFSVGETIEIMKPDGRNIEAEVLRILNEEGKEQESAPHSKQLLYVELSEIPDVYDILRRKEEESK